MYINNITNASTIFKYFIYVDDTNILASHKDINKLYAMVNAKIENIYFWSSVNKLSIEQNKTK